MKCVMPAQQGARGSERVRGSSEAAQLVPGRGQVERLCTEIGVLVPHYSSCGVSGSPPPSGLGLPLCALRNLGTASSPGLTHPWSKKKPFNPYRCHYLGQVLDIITSDPYLWGRLPIGVR